MWSIGIYTGASPFDLQPSAEIRNPVLTRESITDAKASFVADPFMIRGHMFFEVLNHESNKGEIGLATSSDGRGWKY